MEIEKTGSNGLNLSHNGDIAFSMIIGLVIGLVVGLIIGFCIGKFI